MDVPASMQDWWIYLLPGGYSLIQFLMFYDGLTHLLHFPHQLHIGILLNQNYYVPIILIGASASLLIGSFFNNISVYLHFTSKSPFTNLIARSQLSREKKALISRPLLPKILMPKNSANPTENEIQEIMAYWETFVYDRATDRTVDTVQETQVAISFTESFMLSFLTTPFSIVWALGRGYWSLSVGITLFMIFCVGYLLWNANDLREAYWNKVIRAAFEVCQQSSKNPTD